MKHTITSADIYIYINIEKFENLCVHTMHTIHTMSYIHTFFIHTHTHTFYASVCINMHTRCDLFHWSIEWSNGFQTRSTTRIVRQYGEPRTDNVTPWSRTDVAYWRISHPWSRPATTRGHLAARMRGRRSAGVMRAAPQGAAMQLLSLVGITYCLILIFRLPAMLLNALWDVL